MTVDYRDYGIHNATALSGLNAPAGSTITLYNGPMPSVGYVANIDALCQNAPTTPFYKLSWISKDAQGGNTLEQLHLDLLATNVAPASGNGLVTGRGPVRGPWLTVLMHNYDTASMAVDFVLIETSTQSPGHEWGNVNLNISGTFPFAVAAFSTPVSDCSQGNLGSSPALTLLANTMQARVTGLYTGQIQVNVQQPVPFAGTITIYSVNEDFGTPQQIIYQNTIPASGELLLQDFAVPGAPVVIVFANNTAASQTFTYCVTAVRRRP